MDDRSAKPYSYWLRKVATGVIRGIYWDWRKLSGEIAELVGYAAAVLCMTVVRLVVLVTFPVSVPLIALWATRRNREVVELRERQRQEMIRLIKGGQQ